MIDFVHSQWLQNILAQYQVGTVWWGEEMRSS